jgi:hypothetical protein
MEGLTSFRIGAGFVLFLVAWLFGLSPLYLFRVRCLEQIRMRLIALASIFAGGLFLGTGFGTSHSFSHPIAREAKPVTFYSPQSKHAWRGTGRLRYGLEWPLGEHVCTCPVSTRIRHTFLFRTGDVFFRPFSLDTNSFFFFFFLVCFCSQGGGPQGAHSSW